MAEGPKINVHCFADMNELIKEYNWPAEMLLPTEVFDFLYFRMQSECRGINMETGIPFFWFSGTKILPPKHLNTVIVDLSDAEVIDAPS